MTAFCLKLIAAVTMFVDHMGMLLFPQYRIFRIIGRLAFPIYAYCIAEGFRYTKNRRRYFLRVFLLGILCQIVYTIAERELYIGILLVFSLSILLMTVQEAFLSALRGKENFVSARFHQEAGSGANRALSGGIYALSLVGVWALSSVVAVDYGFFGILLPVVGAIFDDKPRRLLAFSIGLAAVSAASVMAGSQTQLYSLFALVPLMLYNGKPGRYRMKTFFYIFYPAHLVFLYALSFLLH